VTRIPEPRGVAAASLLPLCLVEAELFIGLLQAPGSALFAKSQPVCGGLDLTGRAPLRPTASGARRAPPPRLRGQAGAVAAPGASALNFQTLGTAKARTLGALTVTVRGGRRCDPRVAGNELCALT